MHSFISRAQLAGQGGDPPCLFLKIEKIALILEKHTLIVFIFWLKDIKCSYKMLF